MNLPELLIVTNFESLYAYLLEPDGIPVTVKNVNFICDSQTGIPLTACHPEWKDKEATRAIAEKIGEVLDRYHPTTWGLACPAPLGESVVDELRHCHEKKLTRHLTLETNDVHVGNVVSVFSHTECERL
ncbi:MAG: hypothetical protein QM627_05730 [Luteolibacter sp.]